MKNRIGPYLYFDGMLREKKFGDRSFTVVVAAAYDAGIIGPEHNGIVILDDNNRLLMLDRHMQASSGYHGPTAEQKSELDRIMQMDWKTFSKFVSDHPRYRRGIADIDSAASEPDAGDLLDLYISKGKVPSPNGPDLRTPAMMKLSSDSSLDYDFPEATREEMIVALARHEGYHPMNRNNGGFVVSWDIKVRGTPNGFDVGVKHDPSYDERWERYLDEAGDGLFTQACEDALSTYLEGTGSAADETVTAKFYANGRSGGHLVLSEWSGPGPRGWASCPMAFDDREHYISWLKELSNDDLVKFYGLVKSIDAETADPTASVNFYYVQQRSYLENEWAAERLPTM